MDVRRIWFLDSSLISIVRDLAAKGHIANVQVISFTYHLGRLYPIHLCSVRRGLVSHDSRVLSSVPGGTITQTNAVILHEPKQVPVMPISDQVP